jgi:hypothetical protein
VTDQYTFTGVRCSFYLRTAVTGGYRYDHLLVPGSSGDNALRTTMPPAVDDLIWLDPGQCRVIARSWMYPAYGSTNYPYGGPIKEGPTLDLIVESAVGPFTDEAPAADDEAGS